MQGRALLGAHAGAARQYAFGSRDRMDERYDMIRTVTDGRYRYIRNYMPHRPWGQHVAFEWFAKGYQDWEREYRAGRLNADQARFFGKKPYEELYDLKKDRDQLRNLAGRPAQRDRLRKMRQLLDQHMLDVNDNGFIPEGASAEGYETSRKPGAYPLRELMTLAEQSARRRPANLGMLRTRLGDQNEIVRFWATQGLLMLENAARPALPALERAMQTDPSPHVRIVAAEAVAGLANPEPAVAVLTSLLDVANTPPVRLQAMNALTFLGAKARPALPVIRKATADDSKYVNNAARYLETVLDWTYAPDRITMDLRKAGES
jgi:hypothetical protein